MNITSGSPTNNLSWSGNTKAIYKMFKRELHDISCISNFNEHVSLSKELKVKAQMYKQLKNQFFIPKIDEHYLSQIKSFIEQNIPKQSDLLFFTQNMSIGIIDVDLPKVFYDDRNFSDLIDYYPCHMNLCEETINQGIQLDKKRLESASLAIFSSQWAADTAIYKYGTPKEKVKVVPFGANISKDLKFSEIEKIISTKKNKPLQLLFVASNWERKGGERTIEICDILKSKNINFNLHLIISPTCTPHIPLRDYIINHGFLDKKNPIQNSLLESIYELTNFLLVPSKADCTPLIIAECNAFGIPVVARDTGGISSLISENENGFLMQSNDESIQYVEKILNTFSNKESYSELCKSSFHKYKTELNWNSVSEQINELLMGII